MFSLCVLVSPHSNVSYKVPSQTVWKVSSCVLMNKLKLVELLQAFALKTVKKPEHIIDKVSPSRNVPSETRG